MKRSSLNLSGIIIALIVGLALILSQKTLLAQQAAATDTTTDTSATKNDSKALKNGTHKGKKHLKKVNNTEGLAEGKKVKVKEIGKKEIVKTDKKDKEAAAENQGLKNNK